jgi:hypothetical protein
LPGFAGAVVGGSAGAANAQHPAKNPMLIKAIAKQTALAAQTFIRPRRFLEFTGTLVLSHNEKKVGR